MRRAWARREAVRATAKALITEYGHKAATVARLRAVAMPVGDTGDAWRVLHRVERQLRVPARQTDTSTRYFEVQPISGRTGR